MIRIAYAEGRLWRAIEGRKCADGYRTEHNLHPLSWRVLRSILRALPDYQRARVCELLRHEPIPGLGDVVAVSIANGIVWADAIMLDDASRRLLVALYCARHAEGGDAVA